MRRSDLSLPRLMLLHLCFLFLPIAAWAQTATPQSRIVERVNESALVTLRGNTHPLAQPQFDQGTAPPDLPMARMLLVLKRSADQESTLQKLLDDQQDRSSPSYHQWLTPDAFGQQFGPSDQDIQTVAAWLRSHGFRVGQIAQGRAVIEFSGTAAQVFQAFHTEIHKFTVNGEDHWANAGDPQIPAALSPVVAGVNSLHNFPKKPMYRFAGKVPKGRNTGQVQAPGPEFSIPYYRCAISGNCYFVGPYDFARIYNVLPLWNATPAIDGTGQTIAILNESNIDIQDVRDFRNLFGLPANDPQIILNGLDPGLVPEVESEADLDVEWSGAVAKGATIKLVVTAATNATSGVDLSAVYAVENSVGPIISESFGECELFLGTAGNSFQSAIRQQAAAQGITFISSSGDEGSARCDPSSGNPPEPATHGLAVSGLASSPYGVAVGGTDFQNFGANFNYGVPSPYWNLTNDPQQSSALGYVPETTWNSNCTNNVFVILKAGATAEASCNNSKLSYFVDTLGGGGGKSQCTSSNGTNLTSCAGGYAKPSWQSAPGVPADGARDIPDVSLFASPGFMDSAYILCESDQLPYPQPCSLNSPFNTFLGIGGTSASAPAFAGIVALVNQFTGSSEQGNANYVLYQMASSTVQTSQACGATSSPSTTGCIFYDVTSGTNTVPCAKGTPNCTTSTSSDIYGVLSGYNARVGYDLATGLGSVNAFNLVHNWIQPTTSSTTTLSLDGGASVNITHGQSVSFSIVVTPSAAPGVASLMGSPSGGSFVSLASFPLQNGAASGTTASLAGGTSYAVKAHYPGNGTYAPSDSDPVTVTVNPEPSKTLITIPVFDPNTGKETGNAPTSVVYGTPMAVRVDVGNAKATASFPPQMVCAPLTCPTGSVTITDSFNGGAATPLGGATSFPLNTGGFVEDDAVQLSGGSHQFTSSYPGDNSYGASSGTYTLTVTPAPTQVSNPSISNTLLAGSQVYIFTSIITGLFSGAAPTGTVAFYDGTTPLQGTVTLNGVPGIWGAGARLDVSFTTTFTTNGLHQITANYSGDANYAAGTSTASSTTVFYPTTTAVTATSTNINLGQSVTITATSTTTYKSPQITGTFRFTGDPALTGTVTPTLTTDASGNQVLTASVTITPQSSDFVQVSYSGDANFESTASNVFVNVIIPDFDLAASSPDLTITAGQAGTTTLTVTPLSNFSSTVALSCNLMDIVGASCSFNPTPSVALTNSASASTTLSITTLPPSSGLTTQFVGIRQPENRRIPPLGWWLSAFAIGMVILILSLSSTQKVGRLAANLSMVCLLCVALGCGAGNGGGGGGGGGLAPTSVTLSTSAVKAPNGTDVAFTATVNSSKPITGVINLFDSSISPSAAFAAASVVNGTATIHISYFQVGTHVISAQYFGDSNNQPSKTNGSINVAITGLTAVFVQGATSTLTHTMPVNVTIQ